MRWYGFEVLSKTPFLLEALSKPRAGQVFENARRDPTGDVNATPRTVRERHITRKATEHGAEHVESLVRYRTGPTSAALVIAAALRNDTSISSTAAIAR